MRLQVVILASAAALASATAQPPAPRARIVEDLRLDAKREDFPTIRGVYVGPRKQIVVALQEDRQLRWYDATGKHMGSVGRKGGGPGEFEGFSGAGWVADTLWVFDGRLRRTTFVAPNLRVLRATALPQNMTLATRSGGESSRLVGFGPYAVYGDGSMLGDAMTSIQPSSGPPRFTERLARLAPSGAATVVHALPSLDDPRWSIDVGGTPQPVPFTMQPMVVSSWDGTRFATIIADLTRPGGGTFTVTVIRGTGDTLFARSYPFTGAPIPKQTRDSALTKFLSNGGQNFVEPGGSRSPPTATPRPTLPTVYTPAQSILLGMDNTVWITMRATAEGRVALVLNSRGDPVASVLLPPRTVIRQANFSTLWTTQADTDGLTSVVRYKVTGVVCASACR